MNNKSEPQAFQSLLGLIELACWIGILSLTLLALVLSIDAPHRRVLVALAACAAIIVLLLFRWLRQRPGGHPWIHSLAFTGTIFIVAYLSYLFEPMQVHIGVLYMTIIASVGIILGKGAALRATLLSVVAETIIYLLSPQPRPRQFYFGLAAQDLVLLLSGTTISALSGLLHEKRFNTERQNRYLATLLQVGLLASKPGELGEVLSHIAEMIARDVPVTYCRIDLLASPGGSTQAGRQLVNLGTYPIRPFDGWQASRGQRYSSDALPHVKQALETGSYQLVNEPEIRRLRNNTDQNRVANGFYFPGAKSVCILPLVARGQSLGIIAVGEVRRWEREPLSQDKIGFLQTMATQIAAAIYSTQSYQEAQRHARRLEVVNEVARAIGSTIEMDQLLEMIYGQVSQIIPTDTYFVALYDPTEDVMDFRILIDDGQRFPPSRLPIREGLASWVIGNRRPLLIYHLSQEMDHLPVKPVLLGVDKVSESWLGIPMLVGELVLGILAIASYTPFAFDEEDLTLLSNIAAQASLALYNARQHAEVKEQARRDSMTGAYNHSYFLHLLNQALEQASQTQTQVSLIMLDVDYFKVYNDLYGHLVGDQVLVSLVEAIQSHLQKSDFVGRWGGEEFAIGLPGSSPEAAYQVAQSIRETLANLDLRDKRGNRVPRPTISQGIATFPLHAHETFELVDIADTALYEAKNSGRSQVVLAG